VLPFWPSGAPTARTAASIGMPGSIFESGLKVTASEPTGAAFVTFGLDEVHPAPVRTRRPRLTLTIHERLERRRMLVSLLENPSPILCAVPYGASRGRPVRFVLLACPPSETGWVGATSQIIPSGTRGARPDPRRAFGNATIRHR